VSHSASSTIITRAVVACHTCLQDDVKMSRLLGVGAAGCVYQAEWEGQRVAVKLLHPTSADQKSFARYGLAFQPNNYYQVYAC
jgi:predicted Ser/Thr protein kinase